MWIGETCAEHGGLHVIAPQTLGHPVALSTASLSPLLYDLRASYYDDLTCAKQPIELLLEGHEPVLRYAR